MISVLVKAIQFILIICIGYGLKMVGVFKKEDFTVISKIVLYLTLPSAIIVNFSNIEMNKNLMIIVLLGFLCSAFLAGVGYIISFKRSNLEKAFHMLNIAGYNIGCFTIPFAQVFLGPLGIVVICLFDAGNSIMATGGTYAVASSLENKKDNKALFLINKLLHSPPFVCYLILVLLGLLHLELPKAVVGLAEIVGNANAFMAMFMIGIGFQLNLKKEQIIQSSKIIAARYTVSLIFSLLLYYFLPFNLEIKKAMAMVVLSPVSAISTAYTERVGGDVGMSSTINSLCILISLVLISLFLMLV